MNPMKRIPKPNKPKMNKPKSKTKNYPRSWADFLGLGVPNYKRCWEIWAKRPSSEKAQTKWALELLTC